MKAAIVPSSQVLPAKAADPFAHQEDDPDVGEGVGEEVESVGDRRVGSVRIVGDEEAPVGLRDCPGDQVEPEEGPGQPLSRDQGGPKQAERGRPGDQGADQGLAEIMSTVWSRPR